MLSQGTATIQLPGGSAIEDIHLSSSSKSPLPFDLNLHFASLVEVTRIPLQLCAGPVHDVTTISDNTSQWFSNLMLPQFLEQGEQQPWWRTVRSESPLGIVASLSHPTSAHPAGSPRVTEILFYATRDREGYGKPPTPPPSSPADAYTSPEATGTDRFRVCAIPLSADLLCTTPEATPPASPLHEDESIDAVFLPDGLSAPAEVINEPPVRKRRTVAETFDEAEERRKKSRRKGGEGISAAAAVKVEEPTFKSSHRRSVSGSSNQIAPVHTRPLSRSPSVASSRPGTARAPSEAPKRSSLALVQSVASPNDEESLEAKNKEIVSRVVMAGLRMHGLVPRKRRKSQAASAIDSGSAEISAQREEDRQNDDEFKLVYHQVYKGTCFAFRRQIAASSLQPHSEALRDAADKLLDIFCSDPLSGGLPGGLEKLTPGGRKAFGGDSATHHASPFTSAPLVDNLQT